MAAFALFGRIRRSASVALPALVLLLAGAAAAAPDAPPAGVADDLRAELDERFSTIEREAKRLRDAGAAKDAEVLETKLQHFRDRLAGEAGSEGDGPELHVVGIQEAPEPPGAAVVEVGATDRPVVLVLCAYNPMLWEVKLAQGANVQRVILGGYHRQAVSGLPADVPVQKYTHEKDDGTEGGGAYFYTARKDRHDYARAGVLLKQFTGMPIATFQSDYRDGARPFVFGPADRSRPYVVGPADRNWEARRVLTDIAPTYEAAAAFERAARRQAEAARRFPAVQQSPGRHPHELKCALAEFTPAGPVTGTLKPLPERVIHATVDPAGPTWYGADAHDLYRFDPNAQPAQPGEPAQAANAPKKLLPDPGLGQLSWIGGVTFDTRRRRVVVVSFDGGGARLYAYSPDKQDKQWAIFGKPRHLHPQSLTYSPEEDCYYVLGTAMGDRDSMTLYRLSPEGKTEAEVRLAVRVPPLEYPYPGGPPHQLAAVGRRVALISPAAADPDDPDFATRAYCHLLDPKSGAVTYRGVTAPHDGAALAAPPVPPAAEALDALWRALERPDALAADAAMWKLTAAGDAAVAHLRTRLPKVQPPDAARVRALVDQLDHEDAAVRDEATLKLKRLSVPAEPEILGMLNDGRLSPEAATRIDGVLRDIRDNAAIAEIIGGGEAGQLVVDDEAGVDAALLRDVRAVQVLGRIATPAAAKYLREMAAGPDNAPLTVRARLALRQVGRR